MYRKILINLILLIYFVTCQAVHQVNISVSQQDDDNGMQENHKNHQVESIPQNHYDNYKSLKCEKPDRFGRIQLAGSDSVPDNKNQQQSTSTNDNTVPRDIINNGDGPNQLNKPNLSSSTTERDFAAFNSQTGTQSYNFNQYPENINISPPTTNPFHAKDNKQFGNEYYDEGRQDEYLKSLQNRPMVTKTIQIAQPAIKATTYEVHHPAIQKQFYDIEERVLIKPAGTIVVELQRPIAKIPKGETILPLGQPHPAVANAYRNTGSMRASSNTIYSSIGSTSQQIPGNQNNQNNNPKSQVSYDNSQNKRFDSEKFGQYRIQDDYDKLKFDEETNEQFKMYNVSDNRQGSARIKIQMQPKQMSQTTTTEKIQERQNHYYTNTEFDEEEPAHVEEIKSHLNNNKGPVIVYAATARQRPEYEHTRTFRTQFRQRLTDPNNNVDYNNPYGQMRYNPEKFGRIIQQDNTEKDILETSDMISNEKNNEMYDMNEMKMNQTSIKNRTSIQMTVDSDQIPKSTVQITVTNNNNNNNVPKQDTNTNTNNNRYEPQMLLSHPSTNTNNNYIGPEKKANLEVNPNRNQFDTANRASNSNERNNIEIMSRSLGDEMISSDSRVIAATPAPNDPSLTKESIQSRRIVVNHPFQTVREIVEHEPYTNYHKIQIQEPAAPEIFQSTDYYQPHNHSPHTRNYYH